ncbi:group II intron reverse transcriptase/maturase [Anaerolineales bacterium HSG6]|nr:group II intron reverse transcriptase/maturase [Anaerolineales bacterium HSG6]
METSAKLVGASLPNRIEWSQIEWRKLYRNVRRLQARIVKALKAGKKRLVRALQFILVRSLSGKALAVRRVTENQGKRTAGIDGIKWNNTSQKSQAVQTLRTKGYQAKPLRRVYIPKAIDKKRPLGIPIMKDRAMQALYKLALEPIAEATADPNSYGFRPHRAVRDAIGQCFNILCKPTSALWILEGDIKGCFDHINHDWLLKHIPINKKPLAQWLKSGFIEQGHLHATDAGTPQGGIISPILANMALDGLETLLKDNFSKKDKVHLVRYADDFIITAQSKQLLENQVKPLVEQFLEQRGLSLSPNKTHITHINDGFDFLGFNIRKYNGKLIIQPAKKKIKSLLDKIRTILKTHRSTSPARLLKLINPILRGWANYYKHVCAKDTFNYIDRQIWWMLYRWVKRRHPKKSRRWVVKKYFYLYNNRNLHFFGTFKNKKNQKTKRHLFLLAHVSITRHIKIRATANPFDPEYEPYFEKRLDRKMAETFQGRMRLTSLWKQQKGRCLICDNKITTETGWHTHHIIPLSEGGKTKMDNLVLLHPDCHRQLHSLGLTVRKPLLLRNQTGV